MNQIIIDNRHKIDTACQLCFYALEKYRTAVETFCEAKHKILTEPYVDQEKERRINQAAAVLSDATNGYYAETKKNLDVIRAAVNEMESLLDVGEDLQDALSVVKTLGKNMPNETRLGLVERFKGQRQALIILKAAYEAAGIAAETYFEGLILNASDALDRLEEQAIYISTSTGTNMLAVFGFGRALETFAKSMCVELAKSLDDIVDTESMRSGATRVAMGLPLSVVD